jgi:uncharacterized protein YcbK (DUF882 family)
MAGLFLLGTGNSLQQAVANGDTRTLSFHHVHTDETVTITFKRNGRHDDAALKKLNWFMRDWRSDQHTEMDPQLFDLLWEVYRDVGASEPIDVIGGYRSPGTNAMLRARSRGVARLSQHMSGKAMDFYIPGVPLSKIREVGLRLQRGGVGFYPSSGSPFVHMDTSTIRHWPRVSREQLVKIFPNERTVHIPSDGRPLRNYALALADVERRGSAPNGISLAAARDAGVITEAQEDEAEQIGQRRPQRNLFARLFGAGNDNGNEERDEPATTATASPTTPKDGPKDARKPLVLAGAAQQAKPVATRSYVPMPAARPQQAVAVASAQRQLTQPVVTASLKSKPVDQRSIWGDPYQRDPWSNPIVIGASKPKEPAETPFRVASADPSVTGAASDGEGQAAMAFAPERAAAAERPPAAAAVARARPMGKAIPRLAREATVIPTPTNTTIAIKPPPMTSGAQRGDSPWLRAAMLTPSVSAFMTATRLGTLNPEWLGAMIEKPAQALVMTFSADPNFGMVAGRFTGHAVVFLATATFTRQTTAALR